MNRAFIFGFSTAVMVGSLSSVGFAAVAVKCQDAKITVSGKVFNKPDEVKGFTDIIVKDQNDKVIFQKDSLAVSAPSLDDENAYSTTTNRIPPGHYKVIGVLRRPDRQLPVVATEQEIDVCEGDVELDLSLAYPPES